MVHRFSASGVHNYAVESRRFDNLRRHSQNRHALQLAYLLEEFPTLKSAHASRFPGLFRRDPRKTSPPQPSTPPKPVQPPTPLETPSTDPITLDAEVADLRDAQSPTFQREVYRGHTPVTSLIAFTLNTPEVSALSPVERLTSPVSPPMSPTEALRPTPRCPTPAEPLDLSIKPVSEPTVATSQVTTKPAPISDIKGYLAAVMDTHLDRALSSPFMARVINSEHTMESVEENGFRYLRLITIIKGQ